MARWANEEAYDALITAAAERNGVPAALVHAIIATESQFNPSAYRAEPAIGDGSAGLMQILLSTARGTGYFGALGDQIALTGLFDPATNIGAGTKYLAEQFGRAGGDISGTASAYNGGWRPDIGFGEPADRPLTITLARDTVTGQPIKTRNVSPGEYSNQSYVDAVLSNYAYFLGKEAHYGAGGLVNPLTPTGATNPKLVGLLGATLIALVVIRQAQRRRR